MSTKDHPDWWRPVGGQNSQDSVLERRSLVWNDNNVEAPNAPPANYTEIIYKGKFYPRGMRGMLEQLQIYCIRTGIGTLTLRYSPHPCLGPFGEIIITPGATWAWVGTDIEEMWNYDSLFIWVYECDADVSWAYDAVLPYDGHWSTDTGATWEAMAIRPFIRAVYTGETPGDVPVSGIINTIEIPSVGTSEDSAFGVNVPHNAYTLMCTTEGAGTIIGASLAYDTSVAPTAGPAPPAVTYFLALYVDGAYAWGVDNRGTTQSYVATFGRSCDGTFLQGTIADPAWDETLLSLICNVKFRRTASLYAYQSTGGAVPVTGTIYTNLLV